MSKTKTTLALLFTALLSTGLAQGAIGDLFQLRIAPGDVDSDGRLTSRDVQELQEIIFDGKRPSCARACTDVNSDGKTTTDDLIALAKQVVSAPGGSLTAKSRTETVVRGDSDGDGKVNIVDLQRLGEYLFGPSDELGNHYEASDLNEDGTVNIADFYQLAGELFPQAK